MLNQRQRGGYAELPKDPCCFSCILGASGGPVHINSKQDLAEEVEAARGEQDHIRAAWQGEWALTYVNTRTTSEFPANLSSQSVVMPYVKDSESNVGDTAERDKVSS
jgi:hypothetical protein